LTIECDAIDFKDSNKVYEEFMDKTIFQKGKLIVFAMID
jgi:hypothetical protein